MGRRYINISGYVVEWNPAEKKIIITPKDGDAGFSFGIGNAIISVNINEMPEKLTKRIDDDPDFDVSKLAFPIEFATSHLVQPAKDMVKKEITLKLSNGSLKKMEYYEGDIEQFQKSSGAAKVSGLHIHSPGIRLFR